MSGGRSIISNFAVFEGGDGSGTTTQLDLLWRRFEAVRGADRGWETAAAAYGSAETVADSAQGTYSAPGAYAAAGALPPLYPTCEPSDGPVGGLIRRGLRGEIALLPETLARLFAADRGEHLYGAGGVAERCGRGELVVSDRYIPSSLVYQGISCGDELPRRLNEAFPLPGALLFFDLDPEIAQKRMENRPIREIYETLDFQIQVRRRYQALLPQYEGAGVQVTVIDASQSPEAVAEEVWRALKKLPILS